MRRAPGVVKLNGDEPYGGNDHQEAKDDKAAWTAQEAKLIQGQKGRAGGQEEPVLAIGNERFWKEKEDSGRCQAEKDGRKMVERSEHGNHLREQGQGLGKGRTAGDCSDQHAETIEARTSVTLIRWVGGRRLGKSYIVRFANAHRPSFAEERVHGKQPERPLRSWLV